MERPQLSRTAKGYVAIVIALGVTAGAHLLLSGTPLAWDWPPIVLFGLLGVLSSAVSLTYQGYFPSRIAYELGTSFAYALLLLVDPGAVCLVLWVHVAADWGFHRRHPLSAVFNMGQLTVALWVAVCVREWIRPGFTRLDGVDARTLAAAGLAVAAFSIVNLAMTFAIMNLSSRRPFFRADPVTSSGLLNEALCVFSGLGMAVLWWVSPPLVVLGVVPIWILVTLLVMLGRREQELEHRQVELGSLQELGLEIGAELDSQRLPRAVVRIATEALQGSGALIGILDPTHEHPEIVAHQGLREDPPPSVRPSRLTDGFFETDRIRKIARFHSQRELYPELGFVEAEGVLCARLRILDEGAGLLAVFHGPRRRAFDDEDARRLGTLVRFVDVALSNARLVADVKGIQEQLSHAEKMSALGMLVSGLAHELNRPLKSVSGSARSLLGDETRPRARTTLQKIVDEAERAGTIVSNLLAFSRRHKLERESADVNRILDQVLEQRAAEHRSTGVEIVRRLSPRLPAVLVDR